MPNNNNTLNNGDHLDFEEKVTDLDSQMADLRKLSSTKGINYSAYVGHSALRTHAMGERGMEEAATEDDLATMKRELEDSIRAGAIVP